MPKRTEIRNAIAALVTGLTTTGANVSTSRVSMHEALPALVVISGPEELFNVEDGHKIRRYSVGIEARSGIEGLDDQLELMDAEIFAALEGVRLGGLAMDTRWMSTDAPTLSGEGDEPIGLMTIIYEVVYEID